MTIEPLPQTAEGSSCMKNPYIVEASQNTNEGVKRRTLRSPDGTQLMVTNQDGQMLAPAGFWHLQVDKAPSS